MSFIFGVLNPLTTNVPIIEKPVVDLQLTGFYMMGTLVIKGFKNSQEKHLCWSLFLIKLLAASVMGVFCAVPAAMQQTI